jgi:hypothetical protein
MTHFVVYEAADDGAETMRGDLVTDAEYLAPATRPS